MSSPRVTLLECLEVMGACKIGTGRDSFCGTHSPPELTIGEMCP